MTYEFEAKTEKEAIELAAAELGLEKDQPDHRSGESADGSISGNAPHYYCINIADHGRSNP